MFGRLVKREELDQELDEVRVILDKELARGSKIMSDLHDAIYTKPSFDGTATCWWRRWNGVFGADFGKEPTPEPRNRIEVLEKKLDLVMEKLGLKVEWNDETVEPHYEIKKKPAKKKR